MRSWGRGRGHEVNGEKEAAKFLRKRGPINLPPSEIYYIPTTLLLQPLPFSGLVWSLGEKTGVRPSHQPRLVIKAQPPPPANNWLSAFRGIALARSFVRRRSRRRRRKSFSNFLTLSSKPPLHFHADEKRRSHFSCIEMR